jgi:hypothetical protein
MRHEQKLMSLRGNNIHFSRATVFHEMIPGHHLHMHYMARYRPYRQLFLLGDGAMGFSFVDEESREPNRDAVLAHASLRTHHLFVEVSSGRDDCGRMRAVVG